MSIFHRLLDTVWPHQTGHHEVTDDDSSHCPPLLLLTGVEENNAPEHVEQDDGHGHEG